MNDVDPPPPAWGGAAKVQGLRWHRLFSEPEGARTAGAPGPRQTSRPQLRGPTARLPPALGPNDAAARGQLGPAPERPSRRAGRLRPPRGAPSGAREPPWDHHSPLGRDQ